MNDKISADVCEKEFDRMCAARRIVSDTTAMTAVEKAVFEARKRLLLRVMTRGELIVNADGDPQFTPPGGKPLVFHRATGATLMAQDGFGSNEDVARLAAVATVMTKSTPGELSKLDLEDFRIVSDITNFFFDSLVSDKLVVNGKDDFLPVTKKRRNHTSAVVHRTMLWQICRDYGSLPDPRTLTVPEIVFWYDGLRHDLYERTKRRKT